MATYFLLLLQINRKTSHPFIWFYSESVWFGPFSGSIQGTFIWLIQTPNLLSFGFHPCMSSPIFSNNVKECVSGWRRQSHNNPTSGKPECFSSSKRRMRGWRWHSGDWEKRESTEDREGTQEELKDEPQLMRFAVAERKRDLKNSVELQVLYNSRKLYSLLCTTLSTVRLLFSYPLFHNQPCFLASKSTLISL